MGGYEPIDLTACCNAGLELLAGAKDHTAFLERPFLEALARVTQRLQQAQPRPSENHL